MRPRAVIGLFILLLIGTLVPVIHAIYIVNTTGGLRISTTDSAAGLAISGVNKQAVYIGEGSANIRLTPGEYLVSATDQGLSVSAAVRIVKGQTATSALDISGRIKDMNKYNSLISRLPVSGPAFTYTISYYMAYSKGVATPVFTVVSTSASAVIAAKKWFQYYGFEPSTLPIQYSTQKSTLSNDINYGSSYFGSSNVGE